MVPLKTVLVFVLNIFSMYRSNASIRYKIYILINTTIISSIPGVSPDGLVWGNEALPLGPANCRPWCQDMQHAQSAWSRERPTPKPGMVKGQMPRASLLHARPAVGGVGEPGTWTSFRRRLRAPSQGHERQVVAGLPASEGAG